MMTLHFTLWACAHGFQPLCEFGFANVSPSLLPGAIRAYSFPSKQVGGFCCDETLMGS